MKKSLLFILLLVPLLPSYSQSTKLMTYNIRFDNPRDEENSWDLRKDYLALQLKFYSPDILGIQEGLYNQVVFLDSVLADYSYVGVGRDDGHEKGEFSAIFYNESRMELLKTSTFWLSENPEKVSVGWDASMERICTWALFSDRKNGAKLFVMNTHFDHIGQEARKKSVELILHQAEKLNPDNYPVVFTGDLNMEDNSGPIKKLSSVWNDSWHSAEIVSFGPEGSFNAFRFDKAVTRRIDYIFTSQGIRVLKSAILSDSRNLHYPSDHLPAYAEIEY